MTIKQRILIVLETKQDHGILTRADGTQKIILNEKIAEELENSLDIREKKSYYCVKGLHGCICEKCRMEYADDEFIHYCTNCGAFLK